MEIKKEIVINAPPSRIYEAIIEKNQLSQWFPDVVSIEPKIGGKIEFKFSGNSSEFSDTIEGKIVEMEKNKRLAYTWSHPHVPDFPLTKVTWNLEKIKENKTKVIIIHSGFVDEKTMNTYNKKWLWITDHLDSFAVKEKPVSMKEQIASTFIPGVDIWAFYRIKKFRKGTLYITIPVIAISILLTSISFSNYDDFKNNVITDEEFASFQLVLSIGIIAFIAAAMVIGNYFVRKWTKEWNEKFKESPKRSRATALLILVFVYVFDAAIMAIFVGFYMTTPEMGIFVTDMPDLFSFVEDNAIVFFGDWIVELGMFSIIIDALVVVGLLSAHPTGRKIAIGAAVGGLAFNFTIFGIFGFAINSILLWYLFRSKTKESFQISN